MAGSYKKESGNAPRVKAAKMAPPIAAGKNYHGRNINIKIVDDSTEDMYFNCGVQNKGNGLLYVYTPSGNFTYVSLSAIRAVGKKEDDGLMWLIICISKFKARQQLVGKNLLASNTRLLDTTFKELDGLTF